MVSATDVSVRNPVMFSQVLCSSHGDGPFRHDDCVFVSLSVYVCVRALARVYLCVYVSACQLSVCLSIWHCVRYVSLCAPGYPCARYCTY